MGWETFRVWEKKEKQRSMFAMRMQLAFFKSNRESSVAGMESKQGRGQIQGGLGDNHKDCGAYAQ
jgi:hypothetical protein